MKSGEGINVIRKEGAIMPKCEFYDTENLDGYFSGIMYLMVENKRYILDFGYDIEFGKLKLMNCNNPIYNSYGEYYTNEELENVKMIYADVILMEIRNYV